MDNTMGIVWALAAAVMAAFTGVLAARPLRHMGLMSATLLTNVFNMLVLGLFGWWEYDPADVTVEGMLWFALLGVTAYSYGRLVYYKAIDSIGPPRLMTLMSTSPLLSLSLAVLFLGEQPGPAVLAGTGLVVAGVILVSYEPARGRWFQPAILWGFASAVSLGVSVFIRKKGLDAMPNIALTVAWSNMVSIPIIYSLRYISPPALFDWGPRWAVVTIIVVGVLNSGNQLLYNLAIINAEVSVVGPIIASMPIFSVIFTVLMLRDMTRVRPRLVVGVCVTVAGMIGVALGC